MRVVPAQKPRLRLRTILLLVNFMVLVVPLGSIYFFRLYENELIRQTEMELTAQGAFVAAQYKQALLSRVENISTYGIAAQVSPARVDEKYTPLEPVLDLASVKLLPRRPDATTPEGITPDAYALKAGESIRPVLEEATLTTLAGVRVMDYRGMVVAGRAEVGQSLLDTEEVTESLKGQYVARLRARQSKHELPQLASLSRGTGLRVFVAVPVIQGERVLGTVLLSRSPRNILKGLYDNRRSVMIATGIIIGLVALMAWLTSYAISRPIYALIGQTQRVARGEKDIRPIDEPVTQELALLSQHIASMAATLAERSEYIRNFAMHVSHEFKTPLTAIQGAVELIQEHGSTMKPEQLQTFLANTAADTSRLRELVTRLLELARADVAIPRSETCQLDELAGGLASRCREQGLALATPPPQGITLPLPLDIAQTVLGNLLENSRQHGATQATLGVEQSGDAITLFVQDNGRGISPANAEKLFTPFFTTRRGQGGTGLGLVIVRSLLASYKAEIRCVPCASGARFEVRVRRGEG